MNGIKKSFSLQEQYAAFYTGGQIQLSSDGSKLFCSCGKEIKVVDVKTGRAELSIGQNEEEDITAFVLTKDDEYLILATKNQLFRQWRWKENTLVKTWRSVHNAPVTCLAFDSTITLLASGSADSTIKVWDIVRGYFTHNLKGHSGVVRLTAFHPHSERLQLVSGAEDYTVRIWDLKTSSCILVSQCHASLVTSVVFADNGDTMYSSGKDNVVCVWKTDKWKVFKTIPVFESLVAVIVPLEFPSLVDDDGSPRFITVSSKGDLQVVDAKTGKKEYSNSCRLTDPGDDSSDSESYITQALYSPDLNGIVLATYDQNILVLSKDFTIEKQLCGHLDEILSLGFLGEEDSHVAVATNTELLKVFTRKSWECQMLSGHSNIITSLDVRGDFIVSASKDSTIRLWRLAPDTGYMSCMGTGHGHTQAVQTVALARSSNRPSFIISGGVDMTLKIWAFPSDSELTPMSTLRVSATEHAHNKDVNSVCVAPNDRLIATGSQDKTAKLWSVGDGLHTLTLLAVLRGHKRGIWGVQFSPVDQIVATCSGDGHIKLWSVTDFSCVITLEGHDSSVLSIRFLSQGRQILSSGSDGLLKLWLIKTSECLKTLEGHDSKVWATAVTKEQDYILSGGADSLLILWKDITEEEEVEKQEKLNKQILQEQVLSNLIADKKYVRAMGVALTLNKPFKALQILKDISKMPEGEKQLEKLICKLKMDQIESLLKFAVEWNTNSRHYQAAQQVLQMVLKHFLPQDLVKLPGLQAIVEGMTVYTERHLQRLNTMLMDSHFASYCYSCMKTV